eukprot:scaffold57781_cov28-Tisochrysis_lutea.AAC.5
MATPAWLMSSRTETAARGVRRNFLHGEAMAWLRPVAKSLGSWSAPPTGRSGPSRALETRGRHWALGSHCNAIGCAASSRCRAIRPHN